MLPGHHKKRIALIVDISPTILYYHSILMKRLQYAVLTAHDPEQALRMMEQMIPSLILTGLTFAHASGLDFIKKVKSNGHTKSVPVIVLTSVEDAATRSDCLDAGCAACISKPVEPSCLFWTIQEVAEPTPRQHPRIKTSIKAIADGRRDYATSLSEGGLYVRTLSPREKDNVILVSMFINGREVRTRAIVLYSIALGAGAFKEPGMGLKFVDISEQDRDFLRQFIRDHLIADITIDVPDKKTENVLSPASGSLLKRLFVVLTGKKQRP